jgi:N-acetylglucosamine kinase-like BadF-type ATPase
MTRDGLVVAVDGGGVKTDLALLDSSGALLALVRGGRSQAHYLGVDGTVEVLEGLLEAAALRAGLDLRERPVAATAQLLLAGIDLPEELDALRAAMEERRWSERLVIGNDTEALLRAGTDHGWGIAVVCGTGINCIGLLPGRGSGAPVCEPAREARFLSFGQVSGDWGGGRDVGLAALAAAVRALDGRGPRTVLETVVPEHFGFGDPADVARAIYLDEMSLDRLGELAPAVFAVCDDDAVAGSIVRRLADEVVAFAVAAVRRLSLTESDPDVVLGGRLLRAVSSDVVEVIARGVHEVAPAARVVVSPSEPIVGAALLGLDELGADATAVTRARAELDVAAAGLAPAVSVAAADRLG